MLIKKTTSSRVTAPAPKTKKKTPTPIKPPLRGNVSPRPK